MVSQQVQQPYFGQYDSGFCHASCIYFDRFYFDSGWDGEDNSSTYPFFTFSAIASVPLFPPLLHPQNFLPGFVVGADFTPVDVQFVSLLLHRQNLCDFSS